VEQPHSSPFKTELRALVSTYYQLQRLRIQTGNRICRHFAAQLGQEPGMPEEDLSPDAKKLLADLRAEYDLLADAVIRVSLGAWQKRLLDHSGLIASPYDLVMVESYVRLEESEERLARELGALVAQHPLWTSFLSDVRGVGPILGAVILAELDPYRARTVSSFWASAGLDVVLVADEAGTCERDGVRYRGEGRSRRAEHLVKRTYTNKKGEEAERNSITFNPLLKTKLTGVLGPSFLRAGGRYAGVYRDYKHRLESRPDIGIAADEAGTPGATKLHRHAMAIRYAVKQFLADLWTHWRQLEGLPLTDPYHVAKLGMPPHHGRGEDDEAPEARLG